MPPGNAEKNIFLPSRTVHTDFQRKTIREGPQIWFSTDVVASDFKSDGTFIGPDAEVRSLRMHIKQ
eukprot:2327620-Amphidinium_carterae.1